MNTMKIALLLALGSIGAHAHADGRGATANPGKIPVETYSYSTKLDIKRVISMSEPASECAPVPVQMMYEDSSGKRHILEYLIMGTGCSNG